MLIWRISSPLWWWYNMSSECITHYSIGLNILLEAKYERKIICQPHWTSHGKAPCTYFFTAFIYKCFPWCPKPDNSLPMLNKWINEWINYISASDHHSICSLENAYKTIWTSPFVFHSGGGWGNWEYSVDIRWSAKDDNAGIFSFK